MCAAEDGAVPCEEAISSSDHALLTVVQLNMAVTSKGMIHRTNAVSCTQADMYLLQTLPSEEFSGSMELHISTTSRIADGRGSEELQPKGPFSEIA